MGVNEEDKNIVVIDKLQCFGNQCVGLFINDNTDLSKYTLDFQVYLDADDFYSEGPDNKVWFHPYMFIDGAYDD